MSYAELQGAFLGGAKLQGADLYKAKLQGADLGFVKLQGANLISAELQGADLSYANLQYADLNRTKLQGAYFYKCDFRGARDIGEIDKEALDREEAKKLKELVDNVYDFVLDKDKKSKMIGAIDSAVGEKPDEWLKKQDIIFGELTKEEKERFCKENGAYIDKKLRKEIGCDKQ